MGKSKTVPLRPVAWSVPGKAAPQPKEPAGTLARRFKGMRGRRRSHRRCASRTRQRGRGRGCGKEFPPDAREDRRCDCRLGPAERLDNAVCPHAHPSNAGRRRRLQSRPAGRVAGSRRPWRQVRSRSAVAFDGSSPVAGPPATAHQHAAE